jgi:uncharacterized DUF497 family protein
MFIELEWDQNKAAPNLLKHGIVLLFIRPMEIVQTMVSKLQKIFVQTIERIRPGRKYKRNHKVKQKKISLRL